MGLDYLSGGRTYLAIAVAIEHASIRYANLPYISRPLHVSALWLIEWLRVHDDGESDDRCSLSHVDHSRHPKNKIRKQKHEEESWDK